MRLSHPSLEPFEPIVDQINDLIFRTGISALQERGLILSERDLQGVLRSKPSALRRFVRGVHYGFDSAQRKIGALVIDYEIRARKLRAEIKELRRQQLRDEERAHEVLLACLANRQVVLRRLVDSILAHLVHTESWILRRTRLSDTIAPIDPVVLANTLQIASSLNRENRRCIHVVTDLTTAVQVGDLIRLDFDAPMPRRWEIVELKQGKVNDALIGVLDQQERGMTPLDTAAIEEKFGKHGVSQAQRMLRQRKREGEIERFRTVDQGIDLKFNVKIDLISDEVEVRDYYHHLREACIKAQKEQVSAFTLSGCMRVAAVTDLFLRRHGPYAVDHLFLHAKDSNRSANRNAAGTSGYLWPIADLVKINLYAQWPRPIFMWPMPHEMRFDLVFGRLRLFAQLDFDEFFSFAKSRGVELEWVRDKDSTPLARRFPILPGPDKSRGIKASLSGSPTHQVTLLSGFFSRPFLQFMPPVQLLELAREMITSAKSRSCAGKNDYPSAQAPDLDPS
jgi:hypothetical protein